MGWVDLSPDSPDCQKNYDEDIEFIRSLPEVIDTEFESCNFSNPCEA